MRIQFVPAFCAGLLAVAAVAQERQAPVDFTFQHGFLEGGGIANLSELRGKPVYIEWWDLKWPASQMTVPMSVRLADKNRDDLAVLLVSVGSDKRHVERVALQQKWFGKGVFWAGETPLQIPTTEAPFAVLLDARGRPVISGDPIQGQVQFKEAIETELKMAKKGFPDMPKDLRGAYKDAARGKWSAAITEAEELATKQAGKDDALAAAATEAATEWRRRAAMAVARVGRLIEAGEYELAEDRLKVLDGDIEGIDDLESQAAAFQAQLDSKELEAERKAERALRKLEAKLFKEGLRKFKPEQFQKLSEKYPGTKAAARAEYWLPLVQPVEGG